MGNYTILGRFENPRRGMQARNLTTNVPKILYLKSSSEQILSLGAPETINRKTTKNYHPRAEDPLVLIICSYVSIEALKRG